MIENDKCWEKKNGVCWGVLSISHWGCLIKKVAFEQRLEELREGASWIPQGRQST